MTAIAIVLSVESIVVTLSIVPILVLMTTVKGLSGRLVRVSVAKLRLRSRTVGLVDRGIFSPRRESAATILILVTVLISVTTSGRVSRSILSRRSIGKAIVPSMVVLVALAVGGLVV